MLNPQLAFILGILFSPLVLKSPALSSRVKKLIPWFLQSSIILQGAGLNIYKILAVARDGVIITFVSILLVFLVGVGISRLMKIENKLASLITMGTAICGGSAIGALAPAIGADALAISLSMGIVFLLNGLAIYIFPFIGHHFALTQSQFGMWSALAIHDTSSVTATAALYGVEALNLATTLKLTRALWIIPVTLVVGQLFARSQNKVKIPWFIFGFVIMSLIFSFLPEGQVYAKSFTTLAKTGFTLTLLLVGLSFQLKVIATMAWKPLAFGILLWGIVTVVSLLFVMNF